MSDRALCYNIVSNIIKKYNNSNHNQTLALSPRSECRYSSQTDTMEIKLFGISTTTFNPIRIFFLKHNIEIDIAFESNVDYDNEFWIQINVQNTIENYKDENEAQSAEDDDDIVCTFDFICCMCRQLKWIIPLSVILIVFMIFHFEMQQQVIHFIFKNTNNIPFQNQENNNRYNYDFNTEDDVFSDINKPYRPGVI